MALKQTIINNLISIPGYRTKRHIVVIESDDWGSIRMPSKEMYSKLLSSGIRVDQCHYCANDTIATEDDLSLLFELLNSIKDKNGNPAVITANAVVTNPDFDKIKELNFTEYHYRRIDEIFKNIEGSEHALDMWKQGNENRCFRIQSHGREHLNISRWLHFLQNNYPETKLAFDYGVYGISTSITKEKRKSFLPAFDFENIKEENLANEIAADGLKIFEEIFGYKSISFIAPNYIWGKSLEKTLADCGVRYIQGNQFGCYRNSEGENNKRRLRYNGKQNKWGQIDLVRNAIFEPSTNNNINHIDSCIKQIDMAFRWHHPAIICSHRVNYVGKLNINNRDNSLFLLKKLLTQIKKIWPDVEFMSSDQLGDLITNNSNK